MEIGGTLLGLGDNEDAVIYLNPAHGISRYSEVRSSARGLRPGACLCACVMGQLGLEDSRLIPAQTSPGLDPSGCGLDLSRGLPRDVARPWRVILISPETVDLPARYLVRAEEFETLFARMRSKPERLLPLLATPILPTR